MLYSYKPVAHREIKNHYLKINEAVKNTSRGKYLKEVLEANNRAKLGTMAPDFTQFDANGKTVKLSDFKGKYLLLDFWASWCGPCREENPNVVAAYKTFQNKNFEILGISLDKVKDRAAWQKAIQDDGLLWPQVWDKNGDKNAAALQYGVQGIPANFLIDPSGKIIAKNLRGKKLEEKLAEVLDGK